jgi:hypothetical protein
METISCFMLYKEMIVVYSENHTKPICILCGQRVLNVKADGTCIYHRALGEFLKELLRFYEYL